MKTVTVKHLYLKTFLIALATAAVIFVPAMIWDHGYFLFVGDFNSQQIPFYMTAHDAIRSGQWGWNWYTDIGANFIGSYSFYLLGSPFFWLTVPLSSRLVPYMMGPLLILKFGCATLFSTMYFKRYVKNEQFAMLGGLLYAFCGFSIYNIFFNHFHEPLIFFPLMLISLDDLMEKGSHGSFALAVALNALINYYFFFGEVVFIIIYFFVKVACKSYHCKFSRFLQVLFEAVLGFLMSFVLMLPSAMSVMQNSRVKNFPSGFDVWLYYSRERIPAIINSFLFPPELPSKQILLPDANTKWTSLSAFIPIFSVSGVISFMQVKKHDWLTHFLRILILMALIPGLNALYVAFNSSYYARWFYMLSLMLILATVRAMDRGVEERIQHNALIILFIILAIVLAIALTPQFEDGKFQRLGLYDNEFWYFFLIVSAAAIVSILLGVFLVPGLRKEPKKFVIRSIIALCVFSMIYGNVFVWWGKSRSYDTKTYLIPDAIEGEDKITIPDKDQVVRIDTDDSLINMGMFWKISCMRAFHSIVPGSLMDFYTYIGEKRDVSSKIPETQYQVRGLLSVHWYFDRIGMSSDFGDTDNSDGDTLMPDYSYYQDMAGYHVWENEDYIPMGFCYDQYILRSELDKVADADKAGYMLHAVCLDDDQAPQFENVLTHTDDASGYQADQDHYRRDCQVRARFTVSDLTRTRVGVRCTTDFDKDRFVFFSIPYEDGWSLYIDGKKQPLVEANVGFIGFTVPQGDHTIQLEYRTPGLFYGIIITLASVIVWIAYVGICAMTRKKKAHDTEDQAADPQV